MVALKRLNVTFLLLFFSISQCSDRLQGPPSPSTERTPATPLPPGGGKKAIGFEAEIMNEWSCTSTIPTQLHSGHNRKRFAFCLCLTESCNWRSTDIKLLFRHQVYPHALVILNANISLKGINPLNAKLNPICHLLALLEAHPILHVSRIRV
jgi:hypothetical protein